MKLFKKVLLISSLLLVCIYSITFAANTKFPSVTTNKYINDYTGTISKNYTDRIQKDTGFGKVIDFINEKWIQQMPET